MATMRTLNTISLDQAAIYWAGQWFQPTRFSLAIPDVPIMGKEWVLNNLYNATFKDEFEHVLTKFRAQLGNDVLAEFDAAAADRFTPRDDAIFEALLAKKLAINPAGEHIKGMVGTTQVGGRIVGLKTVEVETAESIRYRKKNGLGKKEHRRVTLKVMPNRVPIFAGEVEESGSQNLTDFIRDQSGALNMNISAESAILGLNAIVDNLDEGTGAAIIRGYTGAQPADPDVAATGTLLFTLTCSDPAFGNATDQADGTIDAAAAAITDDTSADATGTLGYIRAHSTNDGVTPLDDHNDGEAGVSGADFNFNTVAVVSGATISITSWVITLDQGTTAN